MTSHFIYAIAGTQHIMVDVIRCHGIVFRFQQLMNFMSVTTIEAEETLGSLLIPAMARSHIPEVPSYFVIGTTSGSLDLSSAGKPMSPAN